MDTQRIIALVVFMFSGMLLWQAWEKHGNSPVVPQSSSAAQTGAIQPAIDKNRVGVPIPTVPLGPAPGAANPTAPVAAMPSVGKRISVTTDTLSVELDTQGGDVRRVTLLKHTARGDATKPFILMQDKVGAYFIAQSGILGQGLPNHTAIWTATAEKYALDGGDKLEVILINTETPGLTVNKVFTFTRGGYVIDIPSSMDTRGSQPSCVCAAVQSQGHSGVIDCTR